MKKLICTILCISLVLTLALTLFSCNTAEENDPTDAPSVYKDEDGLLLTLTVISNGYTITDSAGNVRHFKKITTSTAIAEGGTLQSITDIYGNKGKT